MGAAVESLGPVVRTVEILALGLEEAPRKAAIPAEAVMPEATWETMVDAAVAQGVLVAAHPATACLRGYPSSLAWCVVVAGVAIAGAVAAVGGGEATPHALGRVVRHAPSAPELAGATGAG